MKNFEIIKKECDYFWWIKEHEKKIKAQFRCRPFFSVVLFENGATKEQKKRCLNSIRKQRSLFVQKIVVHENVIKWNEIKRKISGEYVIFVNMRDWLADNAFSEIAKVLETNPRAEWIYSDEDVFREKDESRILPKFKPEWSYDTFLSFFYTGNIAAFKKDICLLINNWEIEYSSYWHYDFALRFLEVCNQEEIVHIAQVLYHVSEQIVSEQESLNDLKRIKEKYLQRNKINAYVEKEDNTEQFRVVYQPTESVSIIIPSKDNVQMLFNCISSIEEHTNYKNYEIIVVDNGSKKDNKKILEEKLEIKYIKYIYVPMEFNFSKMCNIGAQNAINQHLLFLNDDIECIDDKWLERMLGQSEQADVGAVGAKLLYPEENRIQHIGVVNLNMGPSHIFSKEKDGGVLENGRNYLDYNYEAVTGACLLVKRCVFDELKGFDESFPVAYNDVDFCYRLREVGLRNVVRTDAVLIHHESISRGLDVIDKEKNNRLERERTHLYDIHKWIVENGDMAYNLNYSLDWTDFRFDIKSLIYKNSCEVKKLKYEEQEISVIIEEIKIKKDIYIKGWLWYETDQITNLSDVYLVFKNEKKEYWYKAHKQYRPDVAMTLSNESVYSGFECKVLDEREKLHGCKIGVCIDIYNRKHIFLSWTDVIIN